MELAARPALYFHSYASSKIYYLVTETRAYQRLANDHGDIHFMELTLQAQSQNHWSTDK